MTLEIKCMYRYIGLIFYYYAEKIYICLSHKNMACAEVDIVGFEIIC